MRTEHKFERKEENGLKEGVNENQRRKSQYISGKFRIIVNYI